jgi:PAS domain S-box-containing protein
MVRKENDKARKKSRAKKVKSPAAARKRVTRKAGVEETVEAGLGAEPVQLEPAAEETVQTEPITSEPVQAVHAMDHLYSVLSGVSSGVCVFTTDDRVEYFNQRFSEMTGLPDSTIGKKLKKNALWGGRGQKDEFQEIFARARESGAPIILNSQPVGSGEEDQRYWNITLLPQHGEEGGYDGMGLVVEDVTDRTPRISNVELINKFCKAAVAHSGTQALLEDLAHILKDFSRCSLVKILVADKVVDVAFKAETGMGPGLWDMDSPLTPAAIEGIFQSPGSGNAAYWTNGGSIYLDDIGSLEDQLSGGLKELVVNASNSYGFRSIALIPVRLEDRMTGYIQLANKKAGGIPAAVIEAVEIVCEQLKVALDRAGLKDEMRKQREGLLKQMHERGAHLGALSERLKQEVSERKGAQEEMRIQRDLALGLGGIDNLEDALALCLDTAMHVPGIDAGGIYMVEKESGDLVLMCYKGLTPAFASGAGRFAPQTPNAQLVMNNKPVYINLKDAELPLDEGYRAEGLKAAGIIPIAHDNSVIACLDVASHGFEQIPVTARYFLEAVAAEMGSAIMRIMGRVALRESEERYKTLFSRTANPILVIDTDGNYLEANDAALEFLECSREELQAMSVKDTLPPYLDEQWYEDYKKMWESGGTIERDYYVWGKIKVMEMTLTPLQLGGCKTVIGIGRDITERKKAETALRESEEKYRQHFTNVSDVIYSLDCQLMLTDVSPSVEKLLGYKPEELIGRPVNELNLIAPETLPTVYTNVQRVMAGEAVEPIEYQFVAKDGTMKLVEVHGAPMFRGSEIVGVVSVARDITERKKTEEALRKSEEKFKSLVEHINEVFYIQDESNQFVYVSPQAETILGYTQQEFEEMWHSLFTDSPVNAAALEVRKNAIRTGERQPPYRREFYAKDGSMRVVEINETPVKNESGGFGGFVGVARDITDREKANEALKSSEEKFRELADRLPQVVFEVDNDANFTYMNQRGYEIYGYSPDEVIGKLSVFDVIIPEQHEQARANGLKMSKGERSTGNEYLGIKKDGSTFNALAFSDPIVKDGKMVGLRGFFTDITSIKLTEKALRESEEKYRSVIENANEGILVVQDGEFKFANDRLINFSRYTREEARQFITERPFIELIHPDDREMVLENYRERAVSSKAPAQYAFRWLDKDGSTKWAEIRVTSFLWEGKPAVLCFIMDITERKRAEEALKESENKYRLLTDNALDTIWTADMDLQVTYVSPSARYLIGRAPEEIMNMYRQKTLTAEAIGITGEDAKRIWNGMQALIKDPSRTQAFECELKHRDGFTSWIEIKMSIMRDKNGQAAGILGMVRDVSQQKKMLQRLVSADRLASLGEMAAGLAHEVNNPLTAVMGFAYLLEQNPDIPPEIKDDVEAIYREGKRAAEVIKDFLIFARGQKPEKQTIYVNDIIEGVLRLRRSQIEAENIEVSLNLGEDLPAIQGDISQLQQVFLNIILNAEYFIHKSRPGGKLTVTTTQDDGKIKVAIADDGPGIPADKLTRVFDPFFTTKDVGEGTGLGLSICYGIIRGHGGEIYAESEPDRGAVFTVELPVAK